MQTPLTPLEFARCARRLRAAGRDDPRPSETIRGVREIPGSTPDDI